MDLKIDFNNQHILRGHLEQSLSQVPGLGEGNFGRIVVGAQGGLGYKLFPEGYRAFHQEFRIFSQTDMSVVESYFDNVKRYVLDAGKSLRDKGFGLVTIKEGSSTGTVFVTDGIEFGEVIYFAGIGSSDIESAAKFRGFLDMVDSEKAELDRRYQELLEENKKLPKSVLG